MGETSLAHVAIRHVRVLALISGQTDSEKADLRELVSAHMLCAEWFYGVIYSSLSPLQSLRLQITLAFITIRDLVFVILYL
jgi:hypothetical protein